MAWLLAYRLLVTLLTPLLLVVLLLRLGRGLEDPRRLGERLGYSRRRRPAGALVWLHGASVGELTSLVPLLMAIQAAAAAAGRTPPTLLVTSVTRTAAQRARQLLPPGVIHQMVPIDHWLAMLLFRRHWQPQLGLLAEAELWPELIQAMPQLLLINARISQRSYQRHLRGPGLARWLYGRSEGCFPQSAPDAERLRRLGAPAALALGSTKWDAPPLPVQEGCVARLQQLWPQRRVLLLASSHAGEEALLLQAWSGLRQRLQPRPLALLLVPRHPQRAALVRDQVAAAGLAVRLWSDLGQDPALPPGLEVVVVDVLGLMGSWIAAADVVVMGGSLRVGGHTIGGHNPLEPVRGGKPVLCGPDMANFVGLTEQLQAAGWLQQSPTAAALWAAAARWLAQPPALAPAPPLQGPSAQIAAAVLERLPPPRRRS